MGMITRGYSCYARLWANSDDLTLIRWFKAAPGAKVFTGRHRFDPLYHSRGPADSDRPGTPDPYRLENPPPNESVGEANTGFSTADFPRLTDDRGNIHGLTGQSACRPDLFFDGGTVGVDPILPEDADGVPLCCKRADQWRGGSAEGGSWPDAAGLGDLWRGGAAEGGELLDAAGVVEDWAGGEAVGGLWADAAGGADRWAGGESEGGATLDTAGGADTWLGGEAEGGEVIDVALTVEDTSLTTVVPNTTTLEFDDASGFGVSEPSTATAKITLNVGSVLTPASPVSASPTDGLRPTYILPSIPSPVVNLPASPPPNWGLVIANPPTAGPASVVPAAGQQIDALGVGVALALGTGFTGTLVWTGTSWQVIGIIGNNPGNTYQVYDTTQGANGTNIAGRAPSPINVPGGVYSLYNGNFQLQANEIQQNGQNTIGFATYAIAAVSGGNGNLSVSADCIAPSAGSFTLGVAARVTDNNNCYIFLYDSGTGQLRLYKWVGGVSTVLTSTTFSWSLGAVHNMRLSVSGSTLSAYLDGVGVLTKNDTDLDSTHIYYGVASFQQTSTGYTSPPKFTSFAIK